MSGKSLALLAVLVGSLPGTVFAQYRTASASLNAEASLRKLGLQRAWQTQIEFDAARGKLAGVSQHISARSAQTIYEVTYPGGRVTFSDRDLDPFQRPLGPKGAKRAAEEWVETWKSRTKSKAEPEINEQVVPDIVLVATSERGLVQCLNGETGRTLWTNKVGGIRHPTTMAAVNETNVAVINGSTLYMLDRADGHVLWEKQTAHPPGAAPALSDELVFIPMIDGHMDVYYIKEPKRPAASYQSNGRCLVQPVVFRDAVAWPTDKANVYVGNSEVPGVRFRITSKDIINATPTSIRSAPTFRAGPGNTPPLIFFASSDGYVYSAETLKGGIINRFSAGEPISQTPVAVDDQVYVVTDNGTLFCAGADDGQERWFVPGIKSLLAANFDRLYCLDRNNRVVGIDANTGSPLGGVNVGSVDYSFLNTQSDRIYVGTSGGVLICLHESRQHYPLVHGGMEPRKRLPDVQTGEGTSEEMPDEEMPAGDDPFGPKKPAKKPPMDEEDPFGAGPAKKAEKMPEDDDPFGGK